jgi:putative transposase
MENKTQTDGKAKYPHFNPQKYDLQVKISGVKTSSHSKHNLNYHFDWIPKYRKRLLKDQVAKVLGDIIQGQCDELELDLLALEVMPDHIHLFVSADPTHRPCDIIHKIKGNTSIQLRLCFPQPKHLGYPTRKNYENLWARGYYVGSAGHVSQDAVKRYILEQQGKDVFEHSVYENPKQKIGDFTR